MAAQLSAATGDAPVPTPPPIPNAEEAAQDERVLQDEADESSAEASPAEQPSSSVRRSEAAASL